MLDAFGVERADISKGKIAYAAKRIINSREIALSSSKKARQHYDASEKAFKAIRTGKGQPEGLSNAYMSNRGLASKYNKEANMARKVTNMKTIRPSRKLPDTNVFPKARTI